MIHPVTVIAIGVLIVNDHLLKQAHPGLVTGKLSDLAGLMVAPPFIAALLGLVLPRVRAWWLAAVSISVVGAGFAWVKASDEAAYGASAVWSVVNGPSVVRADLTDLLALPALALTGWVWRRVRVRPPSPRYVRLAAACVVLPTAGLAMSATSAPIYDDAVAVVRWQDGAAVGIGDAYHSGRKPRSWSFTTDGRIFSDLEYEATPDVASSTRDCAEPEHCFRVVEGKLRVEESTDRGRTWRTAWEVTDAERNRLATAYDDLDDVDVYLSSISLAVIEQDNGFVVLVANGRDGFAVRDISGQWQRIGFGVTHHDPAVHATGTPWPQSWIEHTATPIPPAGPEATIRGLPLPRIFIPFVSALILVLGFGLSTTRKRMPLVLGCGGAMMLVAGGTVGPSLVGGFPGTFFGFLFWLMGAVLLLTAVIVAAAIAGSTIPARVYGLLAATSITSGLVLAASFVVTFHIGWSSTWSFVVAGVLLAATVAPAAVLLPRWNPPRGRVAASPAFSPPDPHPDPEVRNPRFFD